MTATMSTTTNIRLFCGRDCDGMVRKLEDAVTNSKTVSSLEIRETALEDDVIDSIVDLLSKGYVETIHLEDCSAHLNKSAVRLVEALGNCRDVRLSESTFLSKFFLDSFLESATELKNLRIRDHLLVEQVEALSRGLASNKILHTLDLSRSRIADFSLLSEGLRRGCARRLKLRSIGLRDSHLSTLMEALELPPPQSLSSSPPPNTTATALESLDLSFNWLRNLKCIGEFLKHPDCNLRELLVGYQNLWQPSNNGTNIDISEIANALAHNTTLITLKLPRNELTDSDAILLAVALAENPTLEILDLRENTIRNDGVAALAEAARHSRGLRQLYLRGNPFGIRASQSLLEAASYNFRLFFLTDNKRDEHNYGENEQKTIDRKIRYQTSLNRGGRQLLVDGNHPPLALWPLVLERQTCVADFEGLDEKHTIADKTDPSMRTDVLYYLLKESSPIFFSPQNN